MALLTFHIGVTACQREICAAMVKGGILPIRWGMTGFTLSSIAPVMFIILLVAGIAILRRTFERVIYMALFAGDFGMFAF